MHLQCRFYMYMIYIIYIEIIFFKCSRTRENGFDGMNKCTNAITYQSGVPNCERCSDKMAVLNLIHLKEYRNHPLSLSLSLSD